MLCHGLAGRSSPLLSSHSDDDDDDDKSDDDCKDMCVILFSLSFLWTLSPHSLISTFTLTFKGTS